MFREMGLKHFLTALIEESVYYDGYGVFMGCVHPGSTCMDGPFGSGIRSW